MEMTEKRVQLVQQDLLALLERKEPLDPKDPLERPDNL